MLKLSAGKSRLRKCSTCFEPSIKPILAMTGHEVQVLWLQVGRGLPLRLAKELRVIEGLPSIGTAGAS